MAPLSTWIFWSGALMFGVGALVAWLIGHESLMVMGPFLWWNALIAWAAEWPMRRQEGRKW